MNTKNLVAIFATLVALVGCNVGNANNPTISAVIATAGCNSGMSNNKTCVVTLTYTSHGITGATLGVTYNPVLTPPAFVTNISTCPAPNGTNQTCSVSVTYNRPASGSTRQNLTFTLGNTNSATIAFTGT